MINAQDSLGALQAITDLPSVEHYIRTLKQCQKEKNIVLATTCHLHVCNAGIETVIDNHLLPLFVACGSISSAQQVFSRMAHQNHFAWNSLIQGYVKYYKPQDAIDLYHQMQVHCVIPDKHTFVALLKACAMLKNAEKGREIHLGLDVHGFGGDPFVNSALVHMYSKCDLIEKAREVFDTSAVRDIVSWNAIITGCVEHGLVKEVLHLYEKMQSEGLLPDAVTYICCLKVCASLGSITWACKIHEYVIRVGLESDILLSNALIDTYAKCGLLDEASHVFDNQHFHDVISWTSLITGCIHHGHSEKALLYLEQMQLLGFSLDHKMFSCGLRACGGIGVVRNGQELHFEIVMKGYDQDCFVGNTLMDMYIKCGLISEAQIVFDTLSGRDVVSWNTLITGYIENDFFEEALRCIEEMQSDCIAPDDVTFISFLNVCGNTRAIERIQEMHTEIVLRGFEENNFLGSVLVDVYSKCGLLVESEELFHKSPIQDIILWNSLISGYVEHGCYHEVIICLTKMQFTKVSPDVVTFVSVLKACSNAFFMDFGMYLHSEIIKRGIEKDSFIGNRLVDMYVKFTMIFDAEKVFDGLVTRNNISWNAMIAGYGDLEDAGKVTSYLERMQNQYLSPDAITLAVALKCFATAGQLDNCYELHSHLTKTGLENDPQINSTLIDAYGRCGSLAESELVFETTTYKDLICWTALVITYFEFGLDEQTLECLGHMKSKKICQDSIILTYFLKSCSKIGMIEIGRQLHHDIVIRGFESEPMVSGNLIDLYMNCNVVTEAQNIFDNLQTRDSFSWTALIFGYAEHGQCNIAFNILEQMKLNSISADFVVFSCILKACSSESWGISGQELHMEITKKGLDRNAVITHLLVDMYAQFGLMDECREVFDKLATRDVVSWTALISAYVLNGHDNEIFRCLKEMNVDGFTADVVTFLCLLKYCGSWMNSSKGREFHSEILKKGFDLDENICNSLFDMYVKLSLFLESQEMFNKLPHRDVISWTMFISVLVDNGYFIEAIHMFAEMQQDYVLPNTTTFSCILKACSSIQTSCSGQAIHSEIVKRGYGSDLVIGNTLLLMYAKCDLLNEALQVFDNLPVKDVVSWNTLITYYADKLLTEKALVCFHQMQLTGISPDVRGWNTLIRVHGDHGDIDSSILSYMQMQQQGTIPDNLIYINILGACGSAAALEPAKRIHAQIAVPTGLDPYEEFLDSALINMYGKCGSMADAQQVFDLKPSHGLATWNALMTSYARHGESKNVFCLLERMEMEGIEPDEISLLAVVTVCSHGGLVQAGLGYFGKMGIGCNTGPPSVELHTAMIDMLGRAGQLEEALTLLKVFPCKPDLLASNSLLSSSLKWSHVQIGSQIFDSILLSDGASLILMSNIFAASE